jgi:peroxiredoxin
MQRLSARLAVGSSAYGRTMPLEPGDKAPDFTLLDQHGESFTLSKSLKTKKVRHLIHFCPK